MIAVVVTNKVRKENQEKFLCASLEHKEATIRFDSGCIAFEIAEPKDDTIMFFEFWESKEDLDRHSNASNVRNHIPLMNELRYDKNIEVYTIIE